MFRTLAKKQPEIYSPVDAQKEIGLRGAGQTKHTDRRYMIYVINSARYELARQILAELKKGEAVLLIADECHHYASGQNRLIFEFLPYIKPYETQFFSLGLSATIPSGEDMRYLNQVLGKTIYTYGTSQAAAFGTVCPYDIFHIGLSFQENEREHYQSISRQMKRIYQDLTKMYPFLRGMGQKERYLALQQLAGHPAPKTAKAAASYLGLSYKRKSLVCLAQSRISCALFLVEKLGCSQKILIFGERISQANALYDLLEQRCPGKVGCYHSQMGSQANRNTLLRFRDGDIRILITCKALDEGIDIPDASIGIILSGTSGQRQRTQRLGRIIRKNAGKERAALYYLHITETMEDSCFLPNSAKHAVFDLEYRADTQQLVYPLYDRAAKKWMEFLRLGAADEKQLAEAERCFSFGRVRSDWRQPPEKIDSYIAGASDTKRRNYWICMKKIAEEMVQTFHC